MAYNNYFNSGYQGYYPQFQNGFNQGIGQPIQQIQQPQQPQIQNGGLVSVRNIQEALNYPIAPGNSVMFKDENSPFIYVKTRGFSQLDEPIFEKYRLVKEEQPQTVNNAESVVNIDYALKSDLQAMQNAFLQQINDLQAKIDSLTKKEVKKNANEL